MPRKPTFTRRADEWIESCADRMLSDKTLHEYRKNLTYAWNFGQAHDWPSDPRKIRPGHLRQYFDAIQHLSTGTQQIRTVVLLLFLKWCKNELCQDVNFHITVARSKVDWLTLEQARALLDAAPSLAARAMIASFLMLGIRVGELTALRESDFHDTYVQVRGKGRKARNIPVDQRLWPYLLPYLAERSKLSSPYLFAHEWRDGAKGYSNARVRQLVSGTARRLGFHASPHTLRRTFGRLLYKAGCPLEELRQLFGHSTIEMTVRYLGIGTLDTQDALRLYLPDFGAKVYLQAASQTNP